MTNGGEIYIYKTVGWKPELVCNSTSGPGSWYQMSAQHAAERVASMNAAVSNNIRIAYLSIRTEVSSVQERK